MGFIQAEEVDQSQVQGDQPYYDDDDMVGNYTGDEGEDDAFRPSNELKILQEYNDEKYLPKRARRDFWSLTSKSVKLGFWKDSDYEIIWRHQNIIKLNHLMGKSRKKYSWKERKLMKQIAFLNFADFKRGVGMETFKHNERTMQSIAIQQRISGNSGGPSKKNNGGFMGSLTSMFR